MKPWVGWLATKKSPFGDSLTVSTSNEVAPDLSKQSLAQDQDAVKRDVDPGGIAPPRTDLTDQAPHLSRPTPKLSIAQRIGEALSRFVPWIRPQIPPSDQLEEQPSVPPASDVYRSQGGAVVFPEERRVRARSLVRALTRAEITSVSLESVLGRNGLTYQVVHPTDSSRYVFLSFDKDRAVASERIVSELVGDALSFFQSFDETLNKDLILVSISDKYPDTPVVYEAGQLIVAPSIIAGIATNYETARMWMLRALASWYLKTDSNHYPILIQFLMAPQSEQENMRVLVETQAPELLPMLGQIVTVYFRNSPLVDFDYLWGFYRNLPDSNKAAIVKALLPQIREGRAIEALSVIADDWNQGTPAAPRPSYDVSKLVTAQIAFGVDRLIAAINSGPQAVAVLFDQLDPDSIENTKKLMTNLIYNQFPDIQNRSIIEGLLNAADTMDRQNALEGRADERPTVPIILSPGRLTIDDAGEGISLSTALTKLLEPGASANLAELGTTGKFGAGFLSLFWWLSDPTDRLIIRTVTNGQGLLNEFYRDEATGNIMLYEPRPLPVADLSRILQGSQVEVISTKLDVYRIREIEEEILAILATDHQATYLVAGNKPDPYVVNPQESVAEYVSVSLPKVIEGIESKVPAISLKAVSGKTTRDEATTVYIQINGKRGFGSFNVAIPGFPKEMVIDFHKDVIDYGRERGIVVPTAATIRAIEQAARETFAKRQSGDLSDETALKILDVLLTASSHVRRHATHYLPTPDSVILSLASYIMNESETQGSLILPYDRELAESLDAQAGSVLFVSPRLLNKGQPFVPQSMRDESDQSLLYFPLSARTDGSKRYIVYKFGLVIADPSLRGTLAEKETRELYTKLVREAGLSREYTSSDTNADVLAWIISKLQFISSLFRETLTDYLADYVDWGIRWFWKFRVLREKDQHKQAQLLTHLFMTSSFDYELRHAPYPMSRIAAIVSTLPWQVHYDSTSGTYVLNNGADRRAQEIFETILDEQATRRSRLKALEPYLKDTSLSYQIRDDLLRLHWLRSIENIGEELGYYYFYYLPFSGLNADQVLYEYIFELQRRSFLSFGELFVSDEENITKLVLSSIRQKNPYQIITEAFPQIVERDKQDRPREFPILYLSEILERSMVRIIDDRHIRLGDRAGWQKGLDEIMTALHTMLDDKGQDEQIALINTLKFIVDKPLEKIKEQLDTPGAYDRQISAYLYSLFSEAPLDQSRNADTFSFVTSQIPQPGSQAVFSMQLSDLILMNTAEITVTTALKNAKSLEELAQAFSLYQTGDSRPKPQALKTAQTKIRSAMLQTADPHAFLREITNNAWESVGEQSAKLPVRAYAEAGNTRLAVSMEDSGSGMDLVTLTTGLLNPGTTGWADPKAKHFAQGFYTIFKAADEVRITTTRGGIAFSVIVSDIKRDEHGEMVDAKLTFYQYAGSYSSGTTVEWIKNTNAPEIEAAKFHAALQLFVGLYDPQQLAITYNETLVNGNLDQVTLARSRNEASGETITIVRMNGQNILALNGSYSGQIFQDQGNFYAHLSPLAANVLSRVGIAVNLVSNTVEALEGRAGILNSVREYKRLDQAIKYASIMAAARVVAEGNIRIEDIGENNLIFLTEKTTDTRMQQDALALAHAVESGQDIDLSLYAQPITSPSLTVRLFLSAPFYTIGGRKWSLVDIWQKLADDPEFANTVYSHYPLLRSFFTAQEFRALEGQKVQNIRDIAVERLPDTVPGAEAFRLFAVALDRLEDELVSAGAPIVKSRHIYFASPTNVVPREAGSRFLRVNLAQHGEEIAILHRMLEGRSPSKSEIYRVFSSLVQLLAHEAREGKEADVIPESILPLVIEGRLDPSELILRLRDEYPRQQNRLLPLADFMSRLLIESPIPQEVTFADLSDKSAAQLVEGGVFGLAPAVVVGAKGVVRLQDTESIGIEMMAIIDQLSRGAIQMIPTERILSIEREPSLGLLVSPTSTRNGLIKLVRPIIDSQTGELIRYLDIKGVGNIGINSQGEFVAVIPPVKSNDGDRIDDGLGNVLLEAVDFDNTGQLTSMGIRTNRIYAVTELAEIFNRVGEVVPVEEAIAAGQIDSRSRPATTVRGWGTPFRMVDLMFTDNIEYSVTEEQIAKRRLILEDTLVAIEPELRRYTGNDEGRPLVLTDYLTWFSDTVGREIGRLHYAGYAHQYLGRGHNITTDGRIIDLETLGAGGASIAQRVREFEELKTTLESMIDGINTMYGILIDPQVYVERLELAYKRAQTTGQYGSSRSESDLFNTRQLLSVSPEHWNVQAQRHIQAIQALIKDHEVVIVAGFTPGSQQAAVNALEKLENDIKNMVRDSKSTSRALDQQLEVMYLERLHRIREYIMRSSVQSEQSNVKPETEENDWTDCIATNWPVGRAYAADPSMDSASSPQAYSPTIRLTIEPT